MLGTLGQCLLSLLLHSTAARAQQWFARPTRMEITCRVDARAMQAMQGQCLPYRPAPSTAALAQQPFAQPTPMGTAFPQDALVVQAIQVLLLPGQLPPSSALHVLPWHALRMQMAALSQAAVPAMLDTLVQ